MTDGRADRDVARTALEQVCARGDLQLAPSCYAEDFCDHVNGLHFHGLEGVHRSTALYRSLFDELAIDVVDQISEGDRVASRWVMRGSNRDRRAELTGITISRLRDGRIVEDWTASDGIELLRALGPVRVLRAAPRLLRTVREARSR